MRTLIEFDAVIFGLYEFDSRGPDREGRLLTRLDIPKDTTSLRAGDYSLQLYAKATPNFSGYARVKIGSPLKFKLPHLTYELIGVSSPSLTCIEVPETIVTRDRRVFLEESVCIEHYSTTLLREKIISAGEYFQHEDVWVNERFMLERIKKEGFPVIEAA